MKSIILVFSIFIFQSSLGFAQISSRDKQFNLDHSIALQGYDPVAYFTQNKAIKGNAKFAVSHVGVVYHFSTQQNKDLFLKSPMKYEPQYGGWCAYAMGETGEKVEIDPETYKIRNGKLYLFYHTWAVNTLPKWNKNEINLNIKADANWLKFNH